MGVGEPTRVGINKEVSAGLGLGEGVKVLLQGRDSGPWDAFFYYYYIS